MNFKASFIEPFRLHHDWQMSRRSCLNFDWNLIAGSLFLKHTQILSSFCLNRKLFIKSWLYFMWWLLTQDFSEHASGLILYLKSVCFKGEEEEQNQFPRCGKGFSSEPWKVLSSKIWNRPEMFSPHKSSKIACFSFTWLSLAGGPCGKRWRCAGSRGWEWRRQGGHLEI